MNFLSEQWLLIQQQGYLSVFFTFCIIILLESILSVDNSAALATIINKKLTDEKDKRKVLTYGILGAYLFRGLSLLFVGVLINNPNIGVIAKTLGGLYLIRLMWTFFTPQQDSIEEGDTSWIDKFTSRLGISVFVQTIIAVEFLDLSLSIDNILACISMSKIILVVIVSVFVGILLMRFITMYFIKLMEKYPKLEASAFIVIGLLGLKLVVSGIADYFTVLKPLKSIMDNHTFDFIFSLCTMFIFAYPIIFNKKK